MRRKLICWMLALALILSCAPTALAANEPKISAAVERLNQPQAGNGVSRDRIIRGYEKWRAWWKSWRSETVTYQTDGDWKYYVYNDKAIITAYLGNNTDVTTPTTVGGKDVTVIGSGTFGYITNLNSVTISEGVTQLGDFEFEDGEGGTFIVGYIFEGCESLREVDLPLTLETLGRSNFSLCKSLETITVPTGNVNLNTEDGVLFSVKDADKTMLCYPAAKTDISYTVTAGVHIAEGAMQNNVYLENLKISSGVDIDWRGIEYMPCLKTVNVDDGATSINGFGSCWELESVNLPNSIKNIGKEAFLNCIKLTSITLPNQLETIGGNAFESSGLTSLHIPASVNTIEPSAFTRCEMLTLIEVEEGNTKYEVDADGVLFTKGKETLMVYPAGKSDSDYIVPEGVKTIADSALNSVKLTNITLPQSLESITGWHFNNCVDLESINISSENTLYKDIDGVLLTKEDGFGLMELVAYPLGKSESIYTVPNNVSKIKDSAFISSKLSQVVLPESLVEIENCAFLDSSLTSITIPQNVRLIGESAFAYATLESVTFAEPASVNEICYGAFMGTPLKSVRIPSSVTKIDDDAFSWCEQLASVDVDDANENYKSEDGVLLTEDGKTLLLFPPAKGMYADMASSADTSYAKTAASYTIPEFVENISSYAFASSGLTSITIPKDVKTIESNAFINNKHLGKVAVYSDNVTYPEVDISGLSDALGDAVFNNSPNVVLCGHDGSATQTYAQRNDLTFGLIPTSLSLNKTSETLALGASGKLTATSTPAGTEVSWSSSNPTVVSVDSNGNLHAKAVGTAKITAFSFEIADTCTVTVVQDTFTVTASTNNAAYGRVSGTGVYTNGAIATLTASPNAGCRFVRWTENGAAVSTSLSYSFNVTKNTAVTAEFAVLTPLAISCTKVDADVYGGANGSVTVSASGGDSGTYEYSINSGASWQSSGTFGGLGAATYTAAVRDAGYTSNIATCSVSISQPAHIGNVPAKKVPPKANAGTAVTVVPPAAPKGYTLQSTTFSSSNPSVATVDANGNVTFKAGGKVTITTTVVSTTVDKNGKVKTKTTTVKKTITVQQPVATIMLNMNSATIARKGSVKLAATIAPATASNKKLKWTSSNPKIASVSGAGVVTGKAGGIAVITCTAKDGSGISASCTVTVTPIYPTGIKMSKAALTLKTGKTISLKATIMPKDTDFKTVTWASSNPGVATVDAKGKIKGIAPGTAIISATTSNGLSTSCTVIVQ